MLACWPMRLATWTSLLLFLAASGCRTGSSPSSSTDAPPLPASSAPTPPPPSTPPTAVKESAVASTASGMSAFAADMYRRLAKTETGNIAFSPASISSAFALTWPGARGATAAELERALHFSGPPADVLAAHGALLARSAPGCEVAAGNSAWVQKSLAFVPEYEQTLRQAGSAEVITADFMAQPQVEQERINAWVVQRTRNHIKDLLPPGALDASTRLVLANAIYFKGIWRDAFQKEQTKSEPFYFLSGKTAKVPMMHRTGNYRYFENEQLQLLELPYKCGDMAMVLLLPGGAQPDRTPGALRRMEDALSAPELQRWLGALSPQEVEVTLPRFELNARLVLNPVMQSLGVQLAFSDAADFLGITRSDSLKISGAFHKTWIKVDEEGTEAAAATGIVMQTTSVRLVPSFVADHPFLFLIRDTKTGAILFMGRLAEPG